MAFMSAPQTASTPGGAFDKILAGLANALGSGKIEQQAPAAVALRSFVGVKEGLRHVLKFANVRNVPFDAAWPLAMFSDELSFLSRSFVVRTYRFLLKGASCQNLAAVDPGSSIGRFCQTVLRDPPAACASTPTNARESPESVRLVRRENISARPASDWSVVRTYPRAWERLLSADKLIGRMIAGGLTGVLHARECVAERVCSHAGPIRCRKRGYVLTTDQSDAGSA
eukprot:1054816-Prorocentrum_minimum.AAC.1